MIPIIHIVSFRKGSGKTTLLINLIRKLKSGGIKVIGAKHTVHEIDLRSKDSYKIASAGAEPVFILSPNTTAILINHKMTPIELISLLNLDSGILLVEGMKESENPKIAIITSKDEIPLLANLKNVIAVVSKLDLNLEVPSFKPHEIDELSNYIIKEALKHILSHLGNLNCGACGEKSCNDLAIKILRGERKISDCIYNKPYKVKLRVNGREVKLKSYPRKVLEQLILSFVNTLKEVPYQKNEIQITIEKIT